MFIFSIIFILLSNAVTLRRDKSILFARVAIIALIYSSVLAISGLHINSLDTGISLYGGLFNNPSITQVFHVFIFLIIALILQLTAFQPERVYIKGNYSILFSIRAGIKNFGLQFNALYIISVIFYIIIIGVFSEFFLELPSQVQVCISILFMGILLEIYDKNRTKLKLHLKKISENKITFITTFILRYFTVFLIIYFTLLFVIKLDNDFINNHILSHLETFLAHKFFFKSLLSLTWDMAWLSELFKNIRVNSDLYKHIRIHYDFWKEFRKSHHNYDDFIKDLFIFFKVKFINLFLENKEKLPIGYYDDNHPELLSKNSTALYKSNNGVEETSNDSVNQEGGNDNNNNNPESDDGGYVTEESAHDDPGMTPIPNTPTNEDEAEEMREYLDNKRLESAAGDDAHIKQKAINAYKKDPEHRTDSDKNYIRYAEKNLVPKNLPEKDKMDILRSNSEIESHLGRAARINGEKAREKLVSAGFPDPGSISDVDTRSLSPCSSAPSPKEKPLPNSYPRTKAHDATQGTFTLPGFAEATGMPSTHSGPKVAQTPPAETQDEDMVYDATPPRAREPSDNTFEQENIYDAETPPRAREASENLDAIPPVGIEDQDIDDASSPIAREASENLDSRPPVVEENIYDAETPPRAREASENLDARPPVGIVDQDINDASSPREMGESSSNKRPRDSGDSSNDELEAKRKRK